ncbi:hypothetical protein BGZ72_002971 [Mortierella alpina]|nr:hypothetical protein BGZ72_002971 [Mortierella alpina]
MEDLALAEQLRDPQFNKPIGIPFQQYMSLEGGNGPNFNSAAAVQGKKVPPAWIPPLLPDRNPPVPLVILKALRVFMMGGFPFLAYSKITNRVMGECIFRAILHVLSSFGNCFVTKDVFMHQYRTCFGCPEFNGQILSYDGGLLDAKIIKKFVESSTIGGKNWYRLKPSFIQKYTALPAGPSRCISEEDLDEMVPSSPLDPAVVKQMVKDASHDFINMAMRFVALCPSDFDAGLPFQDMRRFLPVFYMELHPQPAIPADAPAKFEKMDADTFNRYLVTAAVETGMEQKNARKKLEKNSKVVLTALEAERQTELEAYWGPMESPTPTKAPLLIPPPPPPPQNSALPSPPPPSDGDHPMLVARPMSPVTISDDEDDAMDLEEPSPPTSLGNNAYRHDVQSVSSGSEPPSPRSSEMLISGNAEGPRTSRPTPTARTRKVTQERFAPYHAATTRNQAVKDRAPRMDALSGSLPVPLLPSLETLSLKPLKQRRAVILSGPRLPRTESGNPVPALAPGLPQSRTEILKRRREALDKILEYTWRLPMKMAGPAERWS